MLDLFVVSDLVRAKTSQSLTAEATTKRASRPSQHRREAVRLRSAAALRGLANRIEPTRTDPVAG